jgi:hypothetical protein
MAIMGAGWWINAWLLRGFCRRRFARAAGFLRLPRLLSFVIGQPQWAVYQKRSWQPRPLSLGVAEQDGTMRPIVSMGIHLSTWLVVILTVIATVVWVMIVADGNDCWSAFAFMMVTSSLACGVLVFGVVPCICLYLKNKQSRDFKSLWLAAGSCVVLALEAGLLQILPMRGE